MCPYHGFNNLR